MRARVSVVRESSEGNKSDGSEGNKSESSQGNKSDGSEGSIRHVSISVSISHVSHPYGWKRGR